MELKKTPRADLGKWYIKLMFQGIASLFVLSLVIIVLNITTLSGALGNGLGDVDLADIDEEDIEITRPEEKKPPPLETLPEAPEEIEIKENEEELENEVEIEDSETDQEEMIEIEEEFEEPYISASEMPTLGDCKNEDCTQAEIMKFISRNFKYPEIAKANGVEGRVILEFVVEKNGKVGRVKILRGLDKHIDKAALEVIESLPVFTPGLQINNEYPLGKKVPVKYTVPIKCTLG